MDVSQVEWERDTGDGPVCWMWSRLWIWGQVGGMEDWKKGPTVTDALPDINTSTPRIPDAALTVERPVDVDLPYSGGVADDCAGHC